VGLTPEVMLLLSGHDLEATHVECNLPTLRVSRTQATAGGSYLFIWLKIGTEHEVRDRCLAESLRRRERTSFELPLASRAPTLAGFKASRRMT